MDLFDISSNKNMQFVKQLNECDHYIVLNLTASSSKKSIKSDKVFSYSIKKKNLVY